MWRLRRGGKRGGNALLGALAVGLLKALRLTNPDRMADFAGWAMRTDSMTPLARRSTAAVSP